MKSLLSASLMLVASAATAQDANGIWQTQAGDTGGFLHVSIAPCGDKVCGTISQVFGADRQVAKDHEYLGKQMISEMVADGAGKWSNGKIWAPDTDKTYNSKMELTSSDRLKVSGCVLVICRSQTWAKVQ